MKRKRKNKPIPFVRFIKELKLEHDPIQAHLLYEVYRLSGLSFEEWNDDEKIKPEN